MPFPTYDAGDVTGPDLEFGDVNGDGFIDVVVTDTGTQDADSASSGGVSVLLGIGNGSLALPVRYLVGPRQKALRVTLADMNRDGRPEIITMTSPLGPGGNAVAVFTNNGDGSFGPARIYDYGGSGLGFLATGDFNSDGAADIIVPDGTNFSIIFAGEGPLLVTDAPVTVTAIHLNPRDNVAVARVPLAAGMELRIDGVPVTVLDPVPAGHLRALLAAARGRRADGDFHRSP